jgi:hypothetical protein
VKRKEVRQRILDVLHEWGYIDVSIMCGLAINDGEYHNHEAAEELADAIVDFDPDHCVFQSPSQCVRHHQTPVR